MGAWLRSLLILHGMQHCSKVMLILQHSVLAYSEEYTVYLSVLSDGERASISFKGKSHRFIIARVDQDKSVELHTITFR